MEKEIILENLDESIVNEATFYSQQNIPSTDIHSTLIIMWKYNRLSSIRIY